MCLLLWSYSSKVFETPMCSVFSEFQFLAMSALQMFWCYNYNVRVWKGLQECSLDTYHEWTKKGKIFSKLQLFHFTFFNENFNNFCIGSYLWNRILTLKLPGQQNKWGGFVQLLNQMVSMSVWTVLGLFDFESLCAARWTAAQRSFKKKNKNKKKVSFPKVPHLQTEKSIYLWHGSVLA